MNARVPEDILEENIRRLIAASATRARVGFDRQLRRAVLEKVRKERRKLQVRRLRRTGWAIAAASAAAILILATAPWGRRPVPPEKPIRPQMVGRVKTLYGLVSVADGQSPQMVTPVKGVRSGQWVRTHSGSRAEIVLADQSKLYVQPRTSVQIADKLDGQKVVLTRGVLSVVAARQTPGKLLTIETPGAQVTALGTKFDVHVAYKPNGSTQTRVSVTSGKVELTSAGQKALLRANTEGTADEGQRPVVRSLTVEVDEMVRLVEKTRELAAESGSRIATPAIVEFNGDGSATVWSIISVANKTTQPLDRYALSCQVPVAGIEAFWLQGSKVPVTSAPDAWQLDLSDEPMSPGREKDVIIKASGLRGFFEAKGSRRFEFHVLPGGSAALSLLQFRLPGSATTEAISPPPIEIRKTLSRVIITVAVNSELPQFIH